MIRRGVTAYTRWLYKERVTWLTYLDRERVGKLLCARGWDVTRSPVDASNDVWAKGKFSVRLGVFRSGVVYQDTTHTGRSWFKQTRLPPFRHRGWRERMAAAIDAVATSSQT